MSPVETTPLAGPDLLRGPRAPFASGAQGTRTRGSGSSLAAKGFRPFFLLAGAFAALILPVWLLTLADVINPVRYLDALTWHAHEMIFGFTIAVIAGFLLTAVSSWTGRETRVGAPLLGLAALWLAGRVALALAGVLPRGLPAVVDLAFLPALAAAIARPLAAARSRRNFVMVAALGVLWAANIVIHLEALGVVHEWSHRALSLALDVVVLLMIVISGRVLPMFTKNATGAANVRGEPALDKAAIGAMAATSALDAAGVDARIAGAAAGITAVLVLLRARRWGTQHAAPLPLLWILHAGYAWIAIGLGMRTASVFTNVVPSVLATHALTVGAIGALTIGMMTRVTLGHTGRLLVSSRAMTASFVLVTLAAVARVAVPLVDIAAYRASLFIAGGLWTAAFAIFVAVALPILTAPRPDGKPG